MLTAPTRSSGKGVRLFVVLEHNNHYSGYAAKSRCPAQASSLGKSCLCSWVTQSLVPSLGREEPRSSYDLRIR